MSEFCLTLIYVVLRVTVVLNGSVSTVSGYGEDDGRSGSGMVRTSYIDCNSGSGTYPFACSVGAGLSSLSRVS